MTNKKYDRRRAWHHGEASFLNDFYCHVFQAIGSDLDSLCHFPELSQYFFVRDDSFVIILV